MTNSIEFFETQFSNQVANSDLKLNPFETAALPYLQGRMLDFGCGLGNLAVAAARQGCTVLAIDGAPTAIRHLQARSAQENLPITAIQANLRDYDVTEDFDVVVAIGLLMFFWARDGEKATSSIAGTCAPARHCSYQCTVRRHDLPRHVRSGRLLSFPAQRTTRSVRGMGNHRRDCRDLPRSGKFGKVLRHDYCPKAQLSHHSLPLPPGLRRNHGTLGSWEGSKI